MFQERGQYHSSDAKNKSVGGEWGMGGTEQPFETKYVLLRSIWPLGSRAAVRYVSVLSRNCAL